MDKNKKSKNSCNAGENLVTEKNLRSKIGRNNESIRDFLLSKSRYEADAIRVLLMAQHGNPQFDSLPFEDQTVLNRYLMDGLYKEDCNNVDAAKDYRQEKAAQLMKDIGVFFESSQQSLCITVFLMKFASDSTMAAQTFSRLPSRPIIKEDTKESAADSNVSDTTLSDGNLNTSTSTDHSLSTNK